jgi:hypothetical protein
MRIKSFAYLICGVYCEKAAAPNRSGTFSLDTLILTHSGGSVQKKYFHECFYQRPGAEETKLAQNSDIFG